MDYRKKRIYYGKEGYDNIIGGCDDEILRDLLIKNGCICNNNGIKGFCRR